MASEEAAVEENLGAGDRAAGGRPSGTVRADHLDAPAASTIKRRDRKRGWQTRQAQANKFHRQQSNHKIVMQALLERHGVEDNGRAELQAYHQNCAEARGRCQRRTAGLSGKLHAHAPVACASKQQHTGRVARRGWAGASSSCASGWQAARFVEAPACPAAPCLSSKATPPKASLERLRGSPESGWYTSTCLTVTRITLGRALSEASQKLPIRSSPPAVPYTCASSPSTPAGAAGARLDQIPPMSWVSEREDGGGLAANGGEEASDCSARNTASPERVVSPSGGKLCRQDKMASNLVRRLPAAHLVLGKDPGRLRSPEPYGRKRRH